jgi:pyruvate/2-oxoglutarate dehydrogenase complex dihydrolipoamide dehydrogenase (E3) component
MAADYDLIVVGGGTAGLVTAAGGAGLGARVALVERHRLGGECLWTGCVPSKALLACARAAADVRAASAYGIHTSAIQIDFHQVMKHVRQAQLAIEPHDSPERFRSLGVEVIHGTARFVSERTLRVDQRTISGRHIVIATGSRPAIPPIQGLDAVQYHTNETIFELAELPPSIAVLGGGAAGVELAQAFALLGSHVTVLEAADRILPREDAELVAVLAAELDRAGITVKAGRQVQRVDNAGTQIRLHMEGETVSADALLVATSRESILDTLDLSAGGVACTERALTLDDKLRTTARNVWAAGDVTGGPRFTHVADYQARIVLRNALFPLSTSVNYDVVPRVTYTIPELASVGLTADEARRRVGNSVLVFNRNFGDLDRAVADGRTTGLLKIVTTARGRILGGHVLGHHASSIIAEITLAMREKIPLSRLAATLHAYPTYAEAVKHSADAFMRSRFTGFAKTAAGWLVRRT